MQTKLARIFLESALDKGALLMDSFCKLLVSKQVLEAVRKGNTDLFFFFYDTIKQVILEADQSLTKDEVNNRRVAELFQAAWATLDKTSEELTIPVFWPLLLLNITWDEGARHWPVIEGMQPLLLKYLKLGATHTPDAAINLLAFVGDQTLLPDALVTVVDQLRAATVEPVIPYSRSKAETLVRNLYQFHLESIREDAATMAAFRWLLDSLIGQGSTDAYWINEFVISYHRKQKD